MLRVVPCCRHLLATVLIRRHRAQLDALLTEGPTTKLIIRFLLEHGKTVVMFSALCLLQQGFSHGSRSASQAMKRDARFLCRIILAVSFSRAVSQAAKVLSQVSQPPCWAQLRARHSLRTNAIVSLHPCLSGDYGPILGTGSARGFSWAQPMPVVLDGLCLFLLMLAGVGVPIRGGEFVAGGSLGPQEKDLARALLQMVTQQSVLLGSAYARMAGCINRRAGPRRGGGGR